MRIGRRRVLGVGMAIATTLAAIGTGALAAPTTTTRDDAPARTHDRAGPFTEQQRQMRERAVGLLRRGEATTNADGVVQLSEEKYVEAEVDRSDHIFTTLAEFGDQAVGRYGRGSGPLHNEIPEPDRPDDNTTIWRADFDQAYYDDVINGDDNSMADFYDAQSGGVYSVDGEVADWVQVPGNGSSYGDNAIEDYGGAWNFVQDSLDAWAAAFGDGACEYIAQFDTWDRYDWDGDGDFDEPDGYVDHYQAIHAGMGEEVGGGVLGDDAIWSHRWYVGYGFDETGPTVETDEGGEELLAWGGAQVGDCNTWVGDYTTEPENGGLGVFTHEFGHDLGLPDLYDTSGGENSTAFWTLMSSGSYMNDGTEDIGSRPVFMGPWEKLQLGWLDFALVDEDADDGVYTLGSASASNDGGDLDALIIDVDDETVIDDHTTPVSGSGTWWTGSADDLDVSMTREVDLTGVSRATMTVKAWYDIEAGYDYLYTRVSTDGGASWTTLGQLDGSSNGRWKTLRFQLPAGGPVLVQFRYITDGGVHYAGAFLDDLVIRSGGTTVLTDDAEDLVDWTVDGFELSSGSVEREGDRYYLVERRTYDSYDDTLATGPYNWDKAYTAYDHAERFPFQDGFLVWVSNETYGDNNTSEHPGAGIALPLDAHFEPLRWPDGSLVRNRTQPFDATFGDAVPDIRNHRELVSKGKVVTEEIQIGNHPAVATFTDSAVDAYWSSANPRGSSKTAGSGVTFSVDTSSGEITVDYPAAP